jgi:hypothetical protein
VAVDAYPSSSGVYLHLRGKRYTLGRGVRAASDRKPEQEEIRKARSAPEVRVCP